MPISPSSCLRPVASAKTAREAAQAALHGVSREFLADRISNLLETGSAAERSQAAGFAVNVLGDEARPILEKHLDVEKGKRIRDAITAALTTLDLMADDPAPDGEPAPWGAAEDAGGDGYIALDGSAVDLPPMPDLPPDTPLADEAITHLKQAAEIYNEALRDFKAKSDLKKQPWLDNWDPVNKSRVGDYVAYLHGKVGRAQTSIYTDGMDTLLYWDPPFKFDRSHVDAFFNHPDTTIWHLLAGPESERKPGPLLGGHAAEHHERVSAQRSGEAAWGDDRTRRRRPRARSDLEATRRDRHTARAFGHRLGTRAQRLAGHEPVAVLRGES